MLINHDELLRDYGGYEVIQEEFEAALQRFLKIYYQEIARLYGYTAVANEELQVFAAGAGASKFVFGVSVGQDPKSTFGIRLYQSQSKSSDTKLYDRAEDYRIDLESVDEKLLKILVDEIKIYREFQTEAGTGIDVKGIWTRFPLNQRDNLKESSVCPWFYLEDRELKRLLANLGLNALTIGDFVTGYDGRKVLERSEFSLEHQLNAIIQIGDALLQSWLFTTRHHDQRQIVGRTIVDLKPAQFIIPSEAIPKERLRPAVVIDVGPAEGTDDIDTYFKDVNYMKRLIPAFALEMLNKLVVSKSDKLTMKQRVCEGIINSLRQIQQTSRLPKETSPAEFLALTEEFIQGIEEKMA